MKDLEGKLLEKISSEFRILGEKLTAETPLFSSGVIDSLNVMELIMLVEKETGIAIPPTEIVLENFDSVEKIIKLTSSITS